MNKLVNLLNRVLNNNGVKLKKQDEYMYWSPFITHHKRKLQINTQTGKWHCWVSNVGGRNFFQLFKKVSATKEQFNELVELVGENKYFNPGSLRFWLDWEFCWIGERKDKKLDWEYLAR